MIKYKQNHWIYSNLNQFTDFAPARDNAIEKQGEAYELVNDVKLFAKPNEDFKNDLSAADVQRAAIDNKLADLKNHSQTARDHVRLQCLLYDSFNL